MDMKIQKRRFNGIVDVERRDVTDGISYTATASHGSTRATRIGPSQTVPASFLATFTDLAGVTLGLSPTGSELAFNAFHAAWDRDASDELPTTPADRNYAGYDYLAVSRLFEGSMAHLSGKLVAYGDDDTVQPPIEIATYEQYLHLALANEHVLFSSTVDHADEETDDAAVIALCSRIRGVCEHGYAQGCRACDPDGGR